MKLRHGQTMIELLIAVSVISVGLFAAIGLVYSNLTLVNRDTDEVVAINLAREGVELAKHVRDSNWLNGDDFDTGLYDAGTPANATGTPVWDGVIDNPSFDFTSGDFSQPNATVVLSTSTDMPDGVYANANAAGSIAGNPTAFKRLVSFHPICEDHSISPDTCEPALHKVGVRIQSTVQWTRKSVVTERTVYDDIYDWK